MTTVHISTVQLNRLLPAGHITRLFGRLDRCDLGWAGRLRGVLATSIGEVEFAANRDTFSLDLVPGTWVSVRFMHRHRRDIPWVLRAQRAAPVAGTAWLPDAACHRPAHLQRLRQLLSRLAPSMQALFIAALPGGNSHHRFFMRIAALDHHVYPGGLFDQSIAAAEHAFKAWHPNERDRGMATLAALLFDIGKLSDPVLARDFAREGPGLAPHPLTRVRALRACDAVEDQDPELADTVRRLLTTYGSFDGTERLRDVVHRAVAQSWSELPTLRLPREQR